VTGDERERLLRQQVRQLQDEAEIARRLADFEHRCADRERMYRFIESEAANFAVTTLCKVCQVSTSAYYAWLSRGDGPDETLVERAVLANKVYDIWKISRERYGAPSVTAALWREGVQVNEKTVARIMAELAIAGICGRRKVKTTRRDPDRQPAADLVERDFTADQSDQLWLGDITYIPTDEGWLYMASVLDVFSRRLLGWSIADHMRTEICLDALRAASATRGRVRFSDTVFHSDHGSQYTSELFNARCRAMGITQSMGTVGDSYDNAMAESLWASLKRELVDISHFTTKQGARVAVFEWIVWYNTQRLHSSLGYAPPEEFENTWSHQKAA
jgi:putative transposase